MAISEVLSLFWTDCSVSVLMSELCCVSSLTA